VKPVKTGIILFNYGAFGGAPKRFTNLYIHLIKKYPDDFYYFTNLYMFNQIKEIYPEIDTSNIVIIEKSERNKYLIENSKDSPKVYRKVYLDPLGTDKKASLPRKIYWFYKNKLRQFNYYRIIDKNRRELGIKVFCGVFSGVLPLVFYLGKKRPEASVIYTDMDSWFCDVHPDMKKLWYRKYYSYNFALENCDAVDFLSPYILEGVKQLGVKLKEENISVSPCSFTDYSRCTAGSKRKLEVAFCSRLEPDKNPLLYLECAKDILKRHPKVKFHLLGEGSLVNEVKQYIDSNNLGGNINFVFHKNPPEVFSETSIFLSLQNSTNYPSQSLLEAMACGNAVVASDTGDTRLLINEKNGILVPLEPNRITKAIEKLINNKELALKMGKQGSKDVRTVHNIEHYTDYFLGIVQKAYNKNFSTESNFNNRTDRGLSY
jgi:glycosyltransferase involved in cell wall biosynthesis